MTKPNGQLTALQQSIIDEMKRQGVTPLQLAERIGVGRSSLYRMLSKGCNVKHAQRMCDALGMELVRKHEEA